MGGGEPGCGGRAGDLRAGRPADGDVSQNVGVRRGRQKLQTGLLGRLADGTGKALAGVVEESLGRGSITEGRGLFRRGSLVAERNPVGRGWGKGGPLPGGNLQFQGSLLGASPLPAPSHQFSVLCDPSGVPASLSDPLWGCLFLLPPTSGTQTPPSPPLGPLPIHSLAPFLFISHTGPNVDSRHNS